MCDSSPGSDFNSAKKPIAVSLKPKLAPAAIQMLKLSYYDNGKLKMIWSSFSHGRYLVLEAESDSIFGEWKHNGSRFDFDGGHAMLFYTLEGKRMISLHSPNKADYERAVFFEY